jgi:hypothetical protein
MTITTSNNPSQAGSELLEAPRQSVSKALAMKQRLDNYVVTWQNGRPVVAGDDAPLQQAPSAGR